MTLTDSELKALLAASEWLRKVIKSADPDYVRCASEGGHASELLPIDLTELLAAEDACNNAAAMAGEVLALRAALKPFIRSEDAFKGAADEAQYGVYVTIGDLRRIANLLKGTTDVLPE